jgi:pSer/pThr/pTyr-binding forkhead associated (FHA) protein/tetratricopeptide (TPR) repeat protein
MVLAEGVTHLGRAEDNELVLPDIGVSRRHARIVVDTGGVRFEDLGSGNGTFLLGRKVEQHVVADGDEIVVEPFTLLFRVTGGAGGALDDDETLRAPAPEELSAAPARLVTMSGPRLAPVYPLGGAPVTMGRSEAREIVLFDPAASRGHCRVERRADGYWLVDLDSANGTYVNNQRVREQPLLPGDRIRIGATEFRYEPNGPAGAVSTSAASMTAPPSTFAAAPPGPPVRPASPAPAPAPAPAFGAAPGPQPWAANPTPAYPPPSITAAPAPAPIAQRAPPPQAYSAPAPAPAPVHAPPVQAQYAPAPVQAPPQQAARPHAAAAISPVGDASVSRRRVAQEPAVREQKEGGFKLIHLAIAAVVGFFLVLAVAALGLGAWYVSQRASGPDVVVVGASGSAASGQPAAPMIPSAQAEKVEGLMADGRLLQYQGRSLEAVAAFAQAVKLAPAYEDAERMKNAACESIVFEPLRQDIMRRKLTDNEKRALYQDARDLATKAVAGEGPLDEADLAVREALVVFPDDATLVGLRDKVREAVKAKGDAAALNKLRGLIQPVYDQATTDLRAGKWEAAADGFRKVQGADDKRLTWYWYAAGEGLERAERRGP